MGWLELKDSTARSGVCQTSTKTKPTTLTPPHALTPEPTSKRTIHKDVLTR